MLIRLQRIYNFLLFHAIILSFWMLLGLFIHSYIILGTNLVTQGPVQIAVFLPISVLRRKGISNGVQRNETFGRVIFGTKAIQETWSGRQGRNEVAMR